MGTATLLFQSDSGATWKVLLAASEVYTFAHGVSSPNTGTISGHSAVNIVGVNATNITVENRAIHDIIEAIVLIPASGYTLSDVVGDQLASSCGSGLPVSSLTDLSTLSDAGASRRGKHYFLKGATGEEDKEFVVVKDEADGYVYRAIMVAQEA